MKDFYTSKATYHTYVSFHSDSLHLFSPHSIHTRLWHGNKLYTDRDHTPSFQINGGGWYPVTSSTYDVSHQGKLVVPLLFNILLGACCLAAWWLMCSHRGYPSKADIMTAVDRPLRMVCILTYPYVYGATEIVVSVYHLAVAVWIDLNPWVVSEVSLTILAQLCSIKINVRHFATIRYLEFDHQLS